MQLQPISTPELNLLMVAGANERNPVLFRTAFREVSEQCDEGEFKRFLGLMDRALQPSVRDWVYEQFALIYAGSADG